MPFESFPPYPPVDAELVDRIVSKLKSQGIFDQFRKDCLADVDTKPAYQNLQQRVNGTVATFLATQTWQEDLNKIQLRESLRRHVQQGFLEVGVDRIVDQVVNPKIIPVFMPKVEDVVYDCLGIEKPLNRPPPNISGSYLSRAPPLPKSDNVSKPKLVDLLPKDLDPVSPESDNLSLGTPTKDERNNIESSPKYDKEDSQLSGISELSSHLGDSFKENQLDSNTVKSITSPKDTPPELQFDNFTNLSEKIRQAEKCHGQVTDPHTDGKLDDELDTSSNDVLPKGNSELSSRVEENVSEEVKVETVSNTSLSTFEDSKNFTPVKFAREDTCTSFSEDSMASSCFSNKDRNNIRKPPVDSENSINPGEQEDKFILPKTAIEKGTNENSQMGAEPVIKTDWRNTGENKELKRDVDSSVSSKVSRSSDKHKSSEGRHRSGRDKKDDSKEKGSQREKKDRSSRDRSGHKDEKSHSSKEKHKEKDKSYDRTKENDKKTNKLDLKENSEKDKKNDKDYNDKEKYDKDKDRSGRGRHDKDKDRSERDKRERDRPDKEKEKKDKEKVDREKNEKDKGKTEREKYQKDKEKTDKEKLEKDKEKHEKDKDKTDREKHEKEKVKGEKEREEQIKEKSRHDKEKHEKSKQEKYKCSKQDKEKEKSRSSDEKKDNKKKESRKQEKSSHSSSSRKGGREKYEDSERKLKSESSTSQKQNGERSKSEDEKKERKRKGERCNEEIRSKEARRSSDRDSSGGKGGSSHRTSNSENRSGSCRQSGNHSDKKIKSSTSEGTTDCLEAEDSSSQVEKIITQLNSSIEESQSGKEPLPDEVPVKKPKIANSIYEIKKIMQARKNIDRKFRHDLLSNRKEGERDSTQKEEPLSPEQIQNSNIPEENKENIKTQKMEKVRVGSKNSASTKVVFHGFQQSEIDKSYNHFITCSKHLKSLINKAEWLEHFKNGPCPEEILDNNLNNLKPKVKSFENLSMQFQKCYVHLSRSECSPKNLSWNKRGMNEKVKTPPGEMNDGSEHSLGDSNEDVGSPPALKYFPSSEQPPLESPMKKSNPAHGTLTTPMTEDILDSIMMQSVFLDEEDYGDPDDSDYEGSLKDSEIVSELKKEGSNAARAERLNKDVVNTQGDVVNTEGGLPLPESVQNMSRLLDNSVHDRTTNKADQNLELNVLQQKKERRLPKEGAGERVGRRNQRLSRSSQRYESTDLYKPRPVLPQNSKRVRSSRSGLCEGLQKKKSDLSDLAVKRTR